MSGTIVNIMVILALAAVIALAVRSLWQARKKRELCSGDCSQCVGCRK